MTTEIRSNHFAPALSALVLLLALGACNEGNVLQLDDDCEGAKCDAGSGGKGSTGSHAASGSGGHRPAGGSGTGGKGMAGSSGSGGAGASGAGGDSTGGSGGDDNRDGGAGGSGSDGGDGGDDTMDAGVDASLPPIPDYTLVVDAPADDATVSGMVTVEGRAPKFLNVEVWDATHEHPPLASASPDADGTFSMVVDTSALPQGTTTWTVHAWDSPAGEDFTNTASATIGLVIE